jgi:hypothetical protein
MSMSNERTMTPEELRRFLWELLKFKVIEGERNGVRAVWVVDGAGREYAYVPQSVIRQRNDLPSTPEGWLERFTPNWPEDAGAALALCAEIAQRHPGSNWAWTIEIVPFEDGSIYARFGNHAQVCHSAAAPEMALALSRLALAALQGEAKL